MRNINKIKVYFECETCIRIVIYSLILKNILDIGKMAL